MNGRPAMTEARFAAALFDPALPVPGGIAHPRGGDVQRRFAVYRNTVVAGLSEALATGFPAIAKLLGETYFRALAPVFLRAHPPASPVLAEWGEAFPVFLADFAPLRHLPYLADVARLELALRRAYRAADAEPVAPDLLSALDAAALSRFTLRLAPALEILRLATPALSIHRRTLSGGCAPLRPGGEDVLVLRHGFAPAACLLPRGGYTFLAAIRAGRSLAAAGAAAFAEAPDFDAAGTMRLVLPALTGLVPSQPEADRP